MPTTVTRNYHLRYTNEPAWVDSFATLSTEGPRSTYEGGSGDDVYQWYTPMKHGLGLDANRDIYVHGARWWRMRPEVLADPGLDPILYVGLEAETVPLAQEALNPTWVPVTGWQETHFDAPVFLPRGARFCVWYSVEHGPLFTVARDPYHFTVATPSRLGYMTTVVPSAWFQAGGEFGYEPEHTPGDRFDAWYFIDPLVTAAAPLPAPTSFTDNFERADGGLGANWVDHVGAVYPYATTVAPVIASGAATSPNGSLAVSHRNLLMGGGGHDATMTVQFPANNGTVRLFTRMTTDPVASAALLALSRVDAGNLYFSSGLCDAGTDVAYSGGMIAADATTTHTLRIVSNGIHQDYYIDGVLRSSLPDPGVDITGFGFGDYIGFAANGDSGPDSPRILDIAGTTF